MKKIIAALLAICICAVLLVGCGETTTQETPNNTQTAETSGNVPETVSSESATVLATGECGENITWTWDDSETLTLSGEGDMMDFAVGYMESERTLENRPWYGIKDAIETLVIEDGITGVGDYCFIDCTSLLNIALPDSLKRIGDDAFCDCYSLQSLVIPDSVTSLGEEAFNACTSLQSIVIGDGLTEIPDGAFDPGYYYFRSKLKEVTFGKNIQTISSSAFYLSTVKSLIFTGDAVEDITNFRDVNNCVLYYPKDNPTWVDSGVFANWDGKVEGY